MLAAVLVWTMLPLLRPKPPVDAQATRRERSVAGIVTSVAIAGLAVALYAHLSNWDFNAIQAETTKNAEVDTLLDRLEAKLKENPNDVTGWLLLGRSYSTTGRFARGAEAFQHAYDLTKGDNVEALVGLGECLALLDEASLQGRAGKLFEQALTKAPNHPKALWYASMASLQAGDLRTGRDRLKLLLAQNPPDELKTMLERQVQDLTQQLGDGQPGEGAGTPTPAMAAAGPNPAPATNPQAGAAQRSIRVEVSLSPTLAGKVSGEMPLFILARDPQAGGPPLAVQRHSSTQLPLSIELSERDAMMPTRTIATVPKVQVVARLSRSGGPQAQSGDLFGQADYDFATATGTVRIVIDGTVP
jgi:cytochrome c-type biogenesis protein CcmH